MQAIRTNRRMFMFTEDVPYAATTVTGNPARTELLTVESASARRMISATSTLAAAVTRTDIIAEITSRGSPSSSIATSTSMVSSSTPIASAT